MRTLIVGAGALGGLIAARMESVEIPVHLATRDRKAAEVLLAQGLRVSGVGGSVSVRARYVAPIEDYEGQEKFDLVLLATKAPEALLVASRLMPLLVPGGTLLPIQNGAVPKILGDQLGGQVLGGLSNLGATMHAPGSYEQRNAGHLLIGELSGGLGDRVARIAGLLGRAIEIRTSAHFPGALWAKLIVNCAVTTVGAIAGSTMREFSRLASGREVFRQSYDEALRVALASGIRPERMLVEPIPPGWSPDDGRRSGDYDTLMDDLVAAYGDLKPSMLQDFERGRRTEIEYLNGYVARLGSQAGLRVAMNAAITDMVHLIEEGKKRPAPDRLADLLETAGRRV